MVVLDPALKKIDKTSTVEGTYSTSLPGAFGFPFKGAGLILLVSGTIFFGFLEFLSKFTWGPVRLFAFVMVGGYYMGFLLKIVAASANGDKELPGFPDISNLPDEVVRPFLYSLAIWAIAFGPAVVFFVLSEGESTALLVASVAYALIGICYMPMAFLRVALFDSFGSLNPLAVFGSILRVPGEYVVAMVVLLIVLVINVAVQWLVGDVAFLGGVLSGFASLYFAAVTMRIVGMIYYYKSDKLGWFR